MKQLPLGVQLRHHARFATYVTGGNENALATVRGCWRARPATPVIWLWGGPGTGKTHLLQAACAAADEEGRRAGYLPLGEPALAPAALEGWEALDLVCGDGLHAVAGNAAWERALFGLFNGMSERGGTLLVTADRAPAALSLELPDLASRLRSGPVFQLRPLDDGGRLEALQRHASARGLRLPEETARYLLRRTRRDMHSLCATLDRLDRASLVAQRRLTIPFVRELLAAVER